MFDIGFLELLLIAVISLIVMGPKRLPEAVRSISLWLGRLKQIFSSARQQLEDEVGMDDVKRQLHNEQIMRDLKTTATAIKETAAITPEDNSR
jgi:sec-independent protein translocase protein TatB|tara:strand:- start:1966 stop:2244 length:279 start_codon:yes stop_codon:yes gene_type:complete